MRVTRVARPLFLLCTLLVTFGWSAPALAQGGITSTISGIVSDNTGGVVPGANVQLKHNATAIMQESITNNDGTFSFPSMSPGTYTVTVSLQGFKTVVVNNVVVTSGAPANVRATLEVG